MLVQGTLFPPSGYVLLGEHLGYLENRAAQDCCFRLTRGTLEVEVAFRPYGAHLYFRAPAGCEGSCLEGERGETAVFSEGL